MQKKCARAGKLKTFKFGTGPRECQKRTQCENRSTNQCSDCNFAASSGNSCFFALSSCSHIYLLQNGWFKRTACIQLDILGRTSSHDEKICKSGSPLEQGIHSIYGLLRNFYMIDSKLMAENARVILYLL